jgi:hypothetical protein
MQVVIEIESERPTGAKHEVGGWARQNGKNANTGLPA